MKIPYRVQHQMHVISNYHLLRNWSIFSPILKKILMARAFSMRNLIPIRCLLTQVRRHKQALKASCLQTSMIQRRVKWVYWSMVNSNLSLSFQSIRPMKFKISFRRLKKRIPWLVLQGMLMKWINHPSCDRTQQKYAFIGRTKWNQQKG